MSRPYTENDLRQAWARHLTRQALGFTQVAPGIFVGKVRRKRTARKPRVVRQRPPQPAGFKERIYD